MANPSLQSHGYAERGASIASTSWTFNITVPAGSNQRLALVYNGNRDYGALGTAQLRTLKLGTTDLSEVSGADSGTALTVVRSKFYYLDNPASAGSLTVTITNDSNHNVGGWIWQVWQDVDLAVAPAGVGDYAVSATTKALPAIASAAGDAVLIASMGYGGATGTAGANTTVTDASVATAQGVSSRGAMGYATGPNTPSITGWATNQISVAGAVFKAVPAPDTTAPTLSSPTGAGGTLTCSGSVGTDEANGTLYAVATASATAPSAAQVKAGQDNTGAAALRSVSQAVSAAGTQTIASGSCTAGTRYLHYMHEDAAGNQSAVASSASFVVAAAGDTTPPVLSSPVGTATGSATATVGATTDEGNGTLYAVVTTSATQPSVAQIKAGQNNGGTAAAWAGSVAVSSSGAKTLNATGLTASTTYYAHLVHTDAAGNDSNRVSSGSFTTSAPSTATLTSSPLKDNTGALHLGAPFEAFVLHVTTGALILRKTGLTSHASTGVVTFSDAALAASTQYRVVWRRTNTGAQGVELLTAT